MNRKDFRRALAVEAPDGPVWFRIGTPCRSSQTPRLACRSHSLCPSPAHSSVREMLSAISRQQKRHEVMGGR